MDEAERRPSAASTPRWYSVIARSRPAGSAHTSSMRPTGSPSGPATRRPRRSSMWSSAAMSRARDLADDVVAQPVLPVEDRGVVDVEIEPDIDADVAHPMPRDAVRLAMRLAAKAGRQARDEPAEPRPEPAPEGDAADLHEGDGRRRALAQLGDDAVALAHLGLVAVDHLLVEDVADELHRQPPRISSGIVTIASTQPSAITNSTAALAIVPLRCSFT